MKYLYLCLVLLLVLTGCRPGNKAQGGSSAQALPAGMSVKIELEGEPKIGNVPMLIYILNDNQAVTGAKVNIEATMTHAGMTPALAEAQETEAGLYRADPVELEMSGDWIVTATITLPDGSKFSANKPFSVP
jgi:hypothetical protein